MRSSVAKAWPAFCTMWEGRCTWLYLDTKALPTTGLGYRVVDLQAMLMLPWLTADGKPATPSQKVAEWEAVNARKDLAPKGGGTFRAVASLHLPDVEIDRQLMDTTARFWATIAKNHPLAADWPADAQLAMMDLAWQNGPAFTELEDGKGGWVWPNMRAALKAQDWTKAASAVPGTGGRANARRRLFTNAAKVQLFKIDPERLWDTEVPVAPPTPPPPPKEPTVNYSAAYKSDYVWFRGGNVPPVVQAILLAIPSPVTLTQGGLSNSVSASAKTHNGLGAYDIAVKGWSRSRIMTLCAELIRSGEVAFPRGGLFGSSMFVQHVHVVSNNCYHSLHPEAQAQVRAFKNGRDGLARNGRYVGPKVPLGSWKDSPYNPANIRPGGTFEVVASNLKGLNVDRKAKVGVVRQRGYRIKAEKVVKRWGRLNAVTAKGTWYAISDGSQTYCKPVG